MNSPQPDPKGRSRPDKKPGFPRFSIDRWRVLVSHFGWFDDPVLRRGAYFTLHFGICYFAKWLFCAKV